MGALSETWNHRKWQAVLRRAGSVGGYRHDDHHLGVACATEDCWCQEVSRQNKQDVYAPEPWALYCRVRRGRVQITCGAPTVKLPAMSMPSAVHYPKVDTSSVLLMRKNIENLLESPRCLCELQKCNTTPFPPSLPVENT